MLSNRSKIKIIIVVVFMCLGFFALEFAMRFREFKKTGTWNVDYQYYYNNIERIYEPHPFFTRSLKPDSVLHYGKRELAINSSGFRGKEVPLEKSKGILRIACLGGSTTFGFAADDGGSTYPSILQNLLIEKYGKNIEVINAGVPGWMTTESLINFELRLLDYDPDIILLYNAFNDIVVNRWPDFQNDYRHFTKPAVRYKSAKSFFDRSFLVLKLKWKYGRRNKSGNHYGVNRKRYDTVLDEGVQTFERNIRSLVSVARKNNIQVVLSNFSVAFDQAQSKEKQQNNGIFAYAYAPDLSVTGLMDGLKKYNQVQKNIADDLDLVFVDTVSIMNGKDEYFSDSMHFSKEGFQMLASLFASVIIDGRLLDE